MGAPVQDRPASGRGARGRSGACGRVGAPLTRFLAKLRELDADVGRSGLGEYIKKFDAIASRITTAGRRRNPSWPGWRRPGMIGWHASTLRRAHASVMELMAATMVSLSCWTRSPRSSCPSHAQPRHCGQKRPGPHHHAQAPPGGTGPGEGRRHSGRSGRRERPMDPLEVIRPHPRGHLRDLMSDGRARRPAPSLSAQMVPGPVPLKRGSSLGRPKDLHDHA